MAFNCSAMMAAITALMQSPGKNAVAPTSPAQIDVCVMIAMTGAPMKLTSRTPKTTLMIITFHVFTWFHIFSVMYPIQNAASGQLNKYPAEGPTKTERPPRPPDNNGNPKATNRINNIKLIEPTFFLKASCEHNTKCLCSDGYGNKT